MEQFFPILRQCPLFEGVADRELIPMLDCLGGRTLTVRKGQSVFLEGDPASSVGVVLRGAVRLERQDIGGNRSIVARIGSGRLFGETYACAGVQALPVSSYADEDSVLLLLDCRRITTTCSCACGFHSRVIRNLLRLVAEKNLLLDRKLRITAHRTTREKLLAYLQEQAAAQGSRSFSIPYDRQALADYLEVDRSGLSTELGKLRREGVLECEKNRFRLL